MMRLLVRLLPFICIVLCYESIENLWKSAINYTADPCENFHEFACGRWKPFRFDDAISPIDETLMRWMYQTMRLLDGNIASESRAVRKARMFFRACMDYSDLDMKSDFVHGVQRLLGMFSVNPNGVRTNLTSMLVETRLLNPPLLEVYVKPDHANKSKNVIMLYQSMSTVFESPYFFLRRTGSRQYTKEFIDQLAGNLTMVANELGATLNYNAVRRDIDDVLQFQRILAKLQVDNYNRGKQLTVRRLRLSEFSVLFPFSSFSLRDYLHTIAPSELHSYLNSDPEILVGDVKYFEGLVHLLNNAPPEVIINYFILIYASNALHPKEEDERRSYCTIKTKDTLRLAVGALYASEHFKRRYQVTAEHIAEDIRSTFIEMLQGISLAGRELKKRLTDIVTSMRFEIGDSEWIRNTTEVDNFYRELDINEWQTFGEMKRIYAAWEAKAILSELAIPDAQERWTADMIGQYVRSKNLIIIPGPTLQEQTLFSPYHSMPMNWGSVGTIIGHEIMHGLDTKEVREIFANGTYNIYRLWDANTTMDRFQKCLIEQYSAQWVPDISLCLNGTRTLRENIVDNAGVAAAFRAFKKTLNGEYSQRRDSKKLFFISYAQSMCGNEKTEQLRHVVLTSRYTPNRFRVNMILRNQKAFANAFQCPVGSPMNPAHKCKFK